MSTTVRNGEETMWCGHCGVITPTRHEGKAGSVKSCNWCGKVLADETGKRLSYGFWQKKSTYQKTLN
ncbi:hypothetical protein F2Q68_00033989 [Brassica cretica]|uniref:Uncharacterized protein n=1 Tax=Brassica cretica TaxID=69181 RepID=A0A8S9GVL2_BRACR|nr:hypothetical protein F2Q68_00033989 [Brassica cretica]